MKKRIVLSNRLQRVADLVSPGSRACDVGCDHGFVSIYLIEQGICPHVIAMDINEGPLLRAREHIEERKLSAYIETRLSNGMEKVKVSEADSLILAGMGGRLMLQILSENPEKTASLQELILQPQSDIQLVREFLRKQGYDIIKEDMVYEDGKYYPMMKTKAGLCKLNTTYTQEEQDLYGPLLLADRHPVLWQYLKQEQELCKQILQNLEQTGCRTEKQKSRFQELLRKRKQISHIFLS